MLRKAGNYKKRTHRRSSENPPSILKLRIEGKDLPSYKYTDYGSLISLSRFSAVGNLMGNLTGSVMLEGWLARMFYVSLYRMHQMALYGFFRTAMLMLGSKIGRGTEPRLKLH